MLGPAAARHLARLRSMFVKTVDKPESTPLREVLAQITITVPGFYRIRLPLVGLFEGPRA